MKKVSIILALLFTILMARLGGIGSSTAFLKMGGGARPSALGYAYAGFAQGIDAVYWNPAGITQVNKPAFSFTHASLFAGMYLENMAIGIPAGRSIIGIHATGHFSGKILQTTIDDQTGEGGHYYTANNYAVGITYAVRLTDKFSTGFTFKTLSMNIHKVSATGYAFDIGGTYDMGILNTRLGFVTLNYSPTDISFRGEALEFTHAPDTAMAQDVPTTYKSEPFPLPLTFLAGLASDLIKTESVRLTYSADFGYLIDQGEVPAIGIEYAFQEKYFIRLGFTDRNDRDFSAGFGLVVSRPGYRLLIDYATEHHKYLPMIHRISIGMGF